MPHTVSAFEQADLAWVLEINRIHEALLSPLDANGLAALVAEARLARVIRPQSAFMVVFDQSAAYDSPNFKWFVERYPRFLYVDRIAVSPEAGGGGYGRALYDDLFRQAEALGHTTICAEVNSAPPNPGSLAFHDRLGFEAVGEAHLPDRGKSVRYFARTLG